MPAFFCWTQGNCRPRLEQLAGAEPHQRRIAVVDHAGRVLDPRRPGMRLTPIDSITRTGRWACDDARSREVNIGEAPISTDSAARACFTKRWPRCIIRHRRSRWRRHNEEEFHE